ncbi:MAG TPA: outer membrane lipoprotein-sorting protein [Terrimicrobiaceae bacterium]|nr:outer membrane lipoprotein-sorting protein [Terrimicrobiaceae bacterium]
MMPRLAFACFCLAVVLSAANSADPSPQALSAEDLANRLSAWQQDGASYVRLRMENKQPPGTTKNALQIQIKARRAGDAADVFYQILWPKERKGETVLLRKAKDGSVRGWIFVPPDTLRSIGASQMKEPLFGSDVLYEDLVDNHFAWKTQAFVGAGDVNGVNCQILESKPGKGDNSSFTTVRTWIDSRRLIPLRIEKYVAGRLARRIDTANVVTDDIGRQIPANLTVSGSRPHSVTELDGSRIKHDVTYSDRQFTPEALKEVTIPRSSPE